MPLLWHVNLARKDFISIHRRLLQKMRIVELFLGNHLKDNKTEEKLSKLECSEVNPFIENSQKEWSLFLEKRLSLINWIIEQGL